MRYCWPAKRATEVVSQQGWQILRLMSLQQHRQLRARLAAQVSAGLDWLACQRIAADLKLSYTQARLFIPMPSSKSPRSKLEVGVSMNLNTLLPTSSSAHPGTPQSHECLMSTLQQPTDAYLEDCRWVSL
jgi:hypothetical protein